MPKMIDAAKRATYKLIKNSHAKSVSACGRPGWKFGVSHPEVQRNEVTTVPEAGQ
jgi:hypothetical protein